MFAIALIRRRSSPSAYPHLTNVALDDLQADYTALLHETLARPSLRPANLGIIPHKRAWLLHLDVLVLADNGNALDAIFVAAVAALRDTRVPRTKAVEYRSKARARAGQGDVEMWDSDRVEKRGEQNSYSALDTRSWQNATDFELEDYWDEGEPLRLGCNASWPVCITINIVSPADVFQSNQIQYEQHSRRSRPTTSSTQPRLKNLSSRSGSSSSTPSPTPTLTLTCQHRHQRDCRVCGC